MRLALLLALLVFVAIGKGYSQSKIEVKTENATIQEVIGILENQTDYVFLYRDEIFDQNKRYSVDYPNISFEKILQTICKIANVEYEIRNNRQVILKENKEENLFVIDQEKRIISGEVIDINGQPLPSVFIIVKGLNIGTVSDVKGKFKLKIPLNTQFLQFSYVGMKTKEVLVEGRTQLIVVMKNDNIDIDEVAAIGYGYQRKKDITGSISTIKAEKLIDNSPLNVLSGLQGKVAGVYISTASGEPGASAEITIRGYNSISAGTNPLFVVDGMPFDVNTNEIAPVTIGNRNSSNPLNSINPADIETITIFKDASATAIYGSRGANGVIIITTKSGKERESIINFSSTVGFSLPSKKLDVLNGDEFIDYRKDVDPEGYLFFENMDPDYPIDPYELKQHDWQDEILHTGFQQNYNISISGKPDKTDYYLSLGYVDDDAIVKNNNQQRVSMRMKVNRQQSKKLLVGLNTSATYSEINGASQSGGGNALFNGVVQNLVLSTPIEFYNPTFDPGNSYISPSSMIDDAYKKIATFTSNTIAKIDYTIKDGLKINLTGGGSFSSSKGSEFYGKNTNWGVADNGYGSLSESRSYSLNGSAQLHYSKYINDNHHINTLLATEINVYNYEWFNIIKTNFLDESTGVFDISKGSTTKSSSSFRDNSRRVSFLGRLNYIFKEKHVFTATLRADGSDKFGSGNRFGYFPSVAYSWLLIDEKFMHNQSLLSNAKIRISYGVSGNDRIPSHRYLARLANTYYDGELGMAANSQANNFLKWETTYQANFGVDLAFFNNAITITADFYNKQTHDMLIPTPMAGRTGFREQWQNIGRIDNKGVEIQLSSRNINKKDFKWLTDFNISHNKNVVVDLGSIDFIPVFIPGTWIQDMGRVTVGRSLGEAYGYLLDGIYQMSDFTWQENSNPDIPHDDRTYKLNDGVVSVAGINIGPGSHKFKDLNGDRIIKLDDDRQAISSSQPLFFGGIGNTFQYKNFDLNLFFEGSYGNEIFNESKFRLEGGIGYAYMNVSKDFYDNHWTLDNPSNTYGDYADFNPTSYIASDYYVEDASYLRLKSLSIGYTLKNKTLKALNIRSTRIFVTGNNLHTWTNYSGFDPEINSGNLLLSGVDRISYPRVRTFLFGLNVTF